MDPPLHHSSFPPSFFPTSTVTSTTAAGDLNNLPHVSTVPPSSIMGTTFNHPPYAEMIYAAITALKDPEGSSKRAIAKYIETAYSGLPPAHPALLTHHLKRLKNNGLLLMVKKSYKLPRSDNDATSNTVSDVTGPVPHQNFVNEPSIGVKRGRGRPPKPKPVPIAAVPVDTVASDEGHGNHGPGVAVDQQVMVGADGQQDQIVVKRGRGRPKKIGGLGLGLGHGHGHGHVIGGQVGGLAVKRGRGRPPKSVGRPKKPKSVTSIGGIKRRPGRPRKYPQPPLSVPYGPSSLPLAPQPGVAVPGADAPVVNGDTAPVNYAPRPRGRPRKNAAPVSTVGTMVSLPQKRPGRPPGSTGRPVGRPRKIGEPKQQAEAYKDLCRKLEFFQSRLMNAVGVIKPHVTNVSAIEAIVALQEMEGLASMDIRVPFRDESQPQPQPQPHSQQQPQPQPQPQPQHQHQHQFQLHPQPPPQPASQPQLQSQPSPQPQIQPPQSQPTPIQMTIPPFFQHS